MGPNVSIETRYLVRTQNIIDPDQTPSHNVTHVFSNKNGCRTSYRSLRTTYLYHVRIRAISWCDGIARQNCTQQLGRVLLLFSVDCNHHTATALCTRSPVVCSSIRANSSQCFVRWLGKRRTYHIYAYTGGRGRLHLMGANKKHTQNPCRLQQAEQVAVCLVHRGRHATATGSRYL